MARGVEAGAGSDKARPEPPSLVSDCRLMLSFARKNGFVLPATLLHEIAWLDSVLKALDIAPVSQLAVELIWPMNLSAGQPVYLPADSVPASVPRIASAQAEVPGMSPEEVILDIHSRLSLLIAPTTALSLQTSEPPAGKRNLFGGMPPLVKNVIVIALASAICFVISATRIASDRRHPARPEASAPAPASAVAAPTAPAQPSAPGTTAKASEGASS